VFAEAGYSPKVFQTQLQTILTAADCCSLASAARILWVWDGDLLVRYSRHVSFTCAKIHRCSILTWSQLHHGYLRTPELAARNISTDVLVPIGCWLLLPHPTRSQRENPADCTLRVPLRRFLRTWYAQRPSSCVITADHRQASDPSLASTSRRPSLCRIGRLVLHSRSA
jgi:hypothetical protein